MVDSFDTRDIHYINFAGIIVCLFLDSNIYNAWVVCFYYILFL